MPPNIQRQIRIQVDTPRDDYNSDEEASSYGDIKPISNRNMIQKIESMQSLNVSAFQRRSSRFTVPSPLASSFTTPTCGVNKHYAEYLLNHWAVQLFILTITTWAIFGDDIRLLWMSPLVDNAFAMVNWGIMGVFIVEYGANVYIDPKYTYTVFSVLDILSIVSMIPMENLADAAQNIIFLNADGGAVARTGRAAKVGAKAGRIVKATRFLRLGRLVMEAMDTKEVQMDYKRRNSSVVPMNIERKQTLDDRPANCLSHRLSKELTVKVVIIIFLLLVVYPFLGIHHEAFQDRTTLLKNINDGCSQCSDPFFMDNLIQDVVKQNELYYIQACGKTYEPYDDKTPKRYKWITLYTKGYVRDELNHKSKQIIQNELCQDVYGIQSGKSCLDVMIAKTIHPLDNVTAAFYDSALYEQESLMSLYFLIFVLGLLITSSFVISKDTDKISRLISDPLQIICTKMKEMQEFKFNDEISLLSSEIHEINELTDSFKRLQNTIISFSRYVPIPVVKNLMKSNKEASIQVERRTLSIFFSDIKSFTTICEQLKPSEILMLLTEYFDAMEEIVSATNGTILEYVGDAILAVWNAPLELPNHAEKSIECALLMQIKLASLREKWKKDGFPEVSIRVGVNTGEVFHGNIGSHKRLKYGVLGDSVNLASRLEELNKRYNTELLVTNDTYLCGEVSTLFVARPVDIVVVKGKSIPTLLWEIVALKSSADELITSICDLQLKAMNHFLDQEFQEAYITYNEANMLEIQHKQKNTNITLPYRFMYNTTTHIQQRAELLRGSPKIANWDGSEVLQDKHF